MRTNNEIFHCFFHFDCYMKEQKTIKFSLSVPKHRLRHSCVCLWPVQGIQPISFFMYKFFPFILRTLFLCLKIIRSNIEIKPLFSVSIFFFFQFLPNINYF